MLTAADFSAFETEVDKVAAERHVDRVELREALATWVDHDLDVAADGHDVPVEIIIEAAERCNRAAGFQYPEQI